MATYKGIQGYTVENLSSDPTASEAVGQLWYNSDAGKFKLGTAGAGAWASGGSLNVEHADGGGAGTQTAAIYICGYRAAPINLGNEFYDGTTWTEGANLTTMRYGNFGVGTQTAALTGAGTTGPSAGLWTEIYDGTSWTEAGDLTRSDSSGTSFIAPAGAGTTTATRAMFGPGGGSPNSVLNEGWNGTSWSEDADGNTARHAAFGLGTQDAALAAGGNAPPLPYQDVTEIWNGTSWTEVNNMNTARGRGGDGGTTTNGLIIAGTAGAPGVKANVEAWDGTSWTEVADVSTANYGGVGTPSGSSSVSLYAGGQPSGGTACEEWNDPVYTIKTVTVS